MVSKKDFYNMLAFYFACISAMRYVSDYPSDDIKVIISKCIRVDWIVWLIHELGATEIVDESKELTAFCEALVLKFPMFVEDHKGEHISIICNRSADIEDEQFIIGCCNSFYPLETLDIESLYKAIEEAISDLKAKDLI